ncbi:MAG: 3-phosphoshikimate 1-carboxyvinyltransferase [Candidatus Roizmanbacteria bacterium]
MNTIEIIPPNKKWSGSAQVGGSKSYTNRALILAALAKGVSRLSSLSMSDDSHVLITCLCTLGVDITEIDATTCTVRGCGGVFKQQNTTLDVGHAGTAMRFLTAVCCLVPGAIVLDGSVRMRERPINDLVLALRDMGADIQCTGKEGYPPLLIRGGSISSSHVMIRGTVSSQYVSALLLIAGTLKDGLEITITGEQISKSYIDMTMDSLRSYGIGVHNDHYTKYSVAPHTSQPSKQYQIEGDASSASYLFALAAVTGSTITVSNLNPHSAQGDIRFPDLLEQMGCTVVKKKSSITVIGPQKLSSISADMSSMPDTAQTLAVVAACAVGTTHIRGLSTLRVKETDRISATKTELEKIGISCDATDDSLTIYGGSPHGARIHTYQDHRMAMAFSIAGAVTKGVQIEDPQVVNKSFPEYWETLQTLGIRVKQI